MRRVRKAPVLDEVEELRERVAQLEQEKAALAQEVTALKARREAKQAAPTAPTPRAAAQDASDSFAALARAIGGSSQGLRDSLRALSSAAGGGLHSGFDLSAPVESRMPTRRPIPGQVQFTAERASGYDYMTRRVPVVMEVRIGTRREELCLRAQVDIADELMYDSGRQVVEDSIIRCANQMVDAVRSENAGRFSRF